jgi:hypothetical protein
MAKRRAAYNHHFKIHKKLVGTFDIDPKNNMTFTDKNGKMQPPGGSWQLNLASDGTLTPSSLVPPLNIKKVLYSSIRGSVNFDSNTPASNYGSGYLTIAGKRNEDDWAADDSRRPQKS